MGRRLGVAGDGLKLGPRRRDALLRNVVRTHFANLFLGLGDVARDHAELLRAAPVQLLEETPHQRDQRFGLLHQVDELGLEFADQNRIESVPVAFVPFFSRQSHGNPTKNKVGQELRIHPERR